MFLVVLDSPNLHYVYSFSWQNVPRCLFVDIEKKPGHDIALHVLVGWYVRLPHLCNNNA